MKKWTKMPIESTPLGTSVNKITFGQTKVRSECRSCGKSDVKTKAKNGKVYGIPQYTKVFEQVSWFRGEDEYLGIYCKDCIKEQKYLESICQK